MNRCACFWKVLAPLARVVGASSSAIACCPLRRRAAASPTWLALLTRMLTTNLDGPGSTWINSPPTSSANRPVRRSWTLVDSSDLATDQKVGGSSPSERASEPPGHWPDPSSPNSLRPRPQLAADR
jgi:hypothetical protein